MKNKVFEVVQKNFGVIKPGTWTIRTWILYDDRSVENTVNYKESRDNSQKEEKFEYKISILKLLKLKKMINKYNKENDKSRAFDGSAWEFTYYENNTVKWHRESGYIYGVTPLEKISGIFMRLK